MTAQNAPDFDMQAAWLRRFRADVDANLRAFALRLYEAMPEQVAIEESRPLFAARKVTGVTISIGDKRYGLKVAGGQLQATVASVVRGITISTRSVAPDAWFAALGEETRKAGAHAANLSRSLSNFMAG